MKHAAQCLGVCALTCWGALAQGLIRRLCVQVLLVRALCLACYDTLNAVPLLFCICAGCGKRTRHASTVNSNAGMCHEAVVYVCALFPLLTQLCYEWAALVGAGVWH